MHSMQVCATETSFRLKMLSPIECVFNKKIKKKHAQYL